MAIDAAHRRREQEIEAHRDQEQRDEGGEESGADNCTGVAPSSEPANALAAIKDAVARGDHDDRAGAGFGYRFGEQFFGLARDGRVR